ncbi:MAG: DarT ssDNA thymidine ADP-ribosyltransferase family protein [Aggregatilineales bacterium]
MPEKPDADEFRKHLKDLQTGTTGAKRIWPHFLFHFTDVTNVAEILKRNELLSRYQLENNSQKFVDAASSEIISGTANKWKDHVRFYFRPRTPTLFRNEGIRPKPSIQLRDAHCPLPVYLLFDIEPILCDASSAFSTGNLASPRTFVYTAASDFKKLPFDLIYHDGAFSPTERDTIILHRQAEVIIPQRIGLENLRYIWCRSEAERETLRSLLPNPIWHEWQNSIYFNAEHNLFFRYWAYVTKVTLSRTKIVFNFNLPSNVSDIEPFDIVAQVTDLNSEKMYSFQRETGTVHNTVYLNIEDMTDTSHYSVKLFIDNHLAYANTYRSMDDIPF